LGGKGKSIWGKSLQKTAHDRNECVCRRKKRKRMHISLVLVAKKKDPKGGGKLGPMRKPNSKAYADYMVHKRNHLGVVLTHWTKRPRERTPPGGTRPRRGTENPKRTDRLVIRRPGFKKEDKGSPGERGEKFLFFRGKGRTRAKDRHGEVPHQCCSKKKRLGALQRIGGY